MNSPTLAPIDGKKAFGGGYITQPILLDLIKQDPKLSIYTFTPHYYKNANFVGKPGGWEPVSLASALGKWFELTNSATEIYAYLDDNHSDEKKTDQTADQFYYKSRKRAIGPFKSKIMALPENVKKEITSAWENQFKQLFSALAIKDTMKYVNKHTKIVKIKPDLEMYVNLAHRSKEEEDVSDLAD